MLLSMDVIDGGVILQIEASSFWVYPSVSLSIYKTFGCAFERLSLSKMEWLRFACAAESSSSFKKNFSFIYKILV